MHKKGIFLFLPVLMFALVFTLFKPAPTLTSSKTNVVKGTDIDGYLKKIKFNGAALVVKNDRIVLNKGYGYRDLKNKLPNTSQTAFYIASNAKIFVSTSIMQLQEKKKLNIHDTLNKYIPDFPNGNQITLFHLLTQTSGLDQHLETSQKVTHEQLIKKIEKLHLRFKPGSNWFYSDSNYSILAYIVEKVSHEPFDHYVQQHIFNVAKMKNTGYGEKYYQEKNYSKGYEVKNNTVISPVLPDMSELFGCGDIYSTPYNLYLFDKALYSGKLLSKNSLKQLFTPYKMSYALGIYRIQDNYTAHGLLPGYGVFNSFGLKGDKYVILITNKENGMEWLRSINNQVLGMVNNMK